MQAFHGSGSVVNELSEADFNEQWYELSNLMDHGIPCGSSDVAMTDTSKFEGGDWWQYSDDRLRAASQGLTRATKAMMEDVKLNIDWSR